MKNIIVQYIAIAVITTMISFLSINSLIYTRHEGEALAATTSKRISCLDSKIDNINDKLLQIIILLKK